MCWHLAWSRVGYTGSRANLTPKPARRVAIGRVVTLPPVADIRTNIGLSQSEFARLIGVSARTLLTIAHKNPKALLEAMA